MANTKRTYTEERRLKINDKDYKKNNGRKDVKNKLNDIARSYYDNKNR